MKQPTYKDYEIVVMGESITEMEFLPALRIVQAGLTMLKDNPENIYLKFDRNEINILPHLNDLRSVFRTCSNVLRIAVIIASTDDTPVTIIDDITLFNQDEVIFKINKELEPYFEDLISLYAFAENYYDDDDDDDEYYEESDEEKKDNNT